MLIAYARVSTDDQNLDLQIQALEALGPDHMITDKISGAKDDRPGLNEVFDMLAPGDTLAVWKLDRLGRRASSLWEILDILQNRGAHFKSVTEGIDTTTTGGRLVFGVLAAVAQMERETLIERTRAGIQAAKARGVKCGRRRILNRAQVAELRNLMAREDLPRSEVASILGISEATLYRRIREIRGDASIGGIPIEGF